MSSEFYFYDLETTGVDPRKDRIMQFAGQRTDANFEPIGEPHNILIKLTDEVLPSPDAILVTGITPQKTLEEGITEAEFAKIFTEEVVAPNTTYLGFNSIRFDDEFMRSFLFRNFYDSYEWQWKDGASRWDLLDVSRMARALRPDGIVWPVDEKTGKPANRLELLASANKLDHDNAHDALSDVNATIALAGLMRETQPKLFDYLFSMRDKKKVEHLVGQGRPFIYSSGKYSGDYEKTTVALGLGAHPDGRDILVYDLRVDPSEFVTLSPAQLAERWRWKKDREDTPLPVKTLKVNRCPAVAPLSVLDKTTQDRLKINMTDINEHRDVLLKNPDFIRQLQQALEILNKDRIKPMTDDGLNSESSLYQSFVPNNDKQLFASIQQSLPEDLSSFSERLSDPRLKQILPRYKARNYPSSLSSEERDAWDSYRAQVLLAGDQQSVVAKFGQRLEELRARPDITDDQKFLLDEIQLYAESILPTLES